VVVDSDGVISDQMESVQQLIVYADGQQQDILESAGVTGFEESVSSGKDKAADINEKKLLDGKPVTKYQPPDYSKKPKVNFLCQLHTHLSSIHSPVISINSPVIHTLTCHLYKLTCQLHTYLSTLHSLVIYTLTCNLYTHLSLYTRLSTIHSPACPLFSRMYLLSSNHQNKKCNY